MRNRKYQIFLILLLGTLNLIVTNAQSFTMYYMDGVPQSYYFNPATQPTCRIHVGMPIASSFYLKAYSSAFNLNDIFYYDTESDSIRHPLSSEADKQRFLGKFKDVNTISVESAFNLASIGFKYEDWHFSLDITSRLSEQLYYPKDLMVFLLHGNISQTDFNLDNLKIQSHNFTEWGVNVSRKINDQWTVGARPKIMFGIASLATGKSNLKLETDPLSVRIIADYDLQVSLPGVTIPVDEEGIFDPDEGIKFDSTIDSFREYRKLATSNPGFGIDFGAHFKPIDQVEVSLSVLDLGYIKWRKNTHTISLNGTYDYLGVEWTPDDTLDWGESVWDTLKHDLQISGSGKSYKTYLNPKVYLGGRYFINDFIDVGLMTRLEFMKSNIRTDLSILANFRPSPFWSLSTSYGILDGEYTSFGLGMSFIVGPFNLYLISDNITTSYNVIKQIPVPLPDKLYSYNIRIGLNLVFGCNPSKIKDKPMFYKSDYLE